MNADWLLWEARSAPGRSLADLKIRGPEGALFYTSVMLASAAAHTAAVAGPDWVARTLALLSLVVAIASFALTWHLWRKSGPEIVVLVKTATSRGVPVPAGFDDVVDVEVLNHGRMPAMVREVSIRIWDQEPSRRGGGRPTCLTLEPTVRSFPVAVPSTGYISAKMPDGTGVSAGTLVQGIAVLGDGQCYESSLRRIDASSSASGGA